jgi:hypothetical protein
MNKEFDEELEKLLGKESLPKCKDCGNDLTLCPKCSEAICPKCLSE